MTFLNGILWGTPIKKNVRLLEKKIPIGNSTIIIRYSIYLCTHTYMYAYIHVPHIVLDRVT